MIIRCKIDVRKIKKELLFTGAKGIYLDATLLENKAGVDQYGNNFIIIQDISKEARDRGEKGPIIGNAKIVEGQSSRPKTGIAMTTSYSNSDNDIPF